MFENHFSWNKEIWESKYKAKSKLKILLTSVEHYKTSIFKLHYRCEDTSSLLSPLILKSCLGSMREYSLTEKDELEFFPHSPENDT